MSDIFTPSQKTTPPAVQSRLMGARDPQSLPKAWQLEVPLHGLALDTRVNANQFGARLAKMEKQTPTISRFMFPFRIYNPPSQWQADPTWTDSFGPANWRTFQVWTGMAPAWLIESAGTGAPAGSNVAMSQMAYVARTSGFNNAGVMVASGTANYNNAVNTEIVGGQSYNEFYSAVVLGNYPSNPTNGPANTGPANYTNGPGGGYPNSCYEVTFTANPSSVAVFWISWDTNLTAGGVPYYQVPSSGNSYTSFPVLHFGGLDATGAYYGDLNSTNGPKILGSLSTGSFDALTPPQIFPYFPANAFASPFNNGSQTPEGTIIVGAIVIGSSGAAQNTGNGDGVVQIFQALFDNIRYQPGRVQMRGQWNMNTFYYPGDIAIESGGGANTTYIQSAPVALQGVDPYATQNASQTLSGPNYSSFVNLWTAMGGGNGGNGGQDYFGTVVSEGHSTVICNTANGINIVYQINLLGGGTNYTTVPTVSITGGGGGGATAVATINATSNVVASLILETGGSGFTSVPNVSFSGGGSPTVNATANCLIGPGFTMAKPPEFRGFVNNNANVTAIVPPYGSGNIVFACTPIGGTNVANVILQDINSTGRALGTNFPTCENVSGTPTAKNRFFVCGPPF